MKRLFFILQIVTFLMASCTPKPVDIDIKESAPQMAISSSVIDAHTIFLTATYSINSLGNLNDTSNNAIPQAISANMLVQDGLVTISSDAGIDTLTKIYNGLYGSYTLNLVPYKLYLLKVTDRKNGSTISAPTIYLPVTTVNQVLPSVKRNTYDTIVKLNISVQDDPSRTDYFLMSYNTINPSTIPSPLGGNSFPVINSDASKKLELFTDADAVGGVITREFVLSIGSKDTVYTHIGRIDKAYYEYLTAYKRMGSFINQFTGEPITLPTNVIVGLGFFNLYEEKRQVFDLNDF